MKYVLPLLLLTAAPVMADGWLSRRMETAGELRRARFEYRLAYPQLLSLIESQRVQTNAQILATYQSGLNYTTQPSTTRPAR
jgi:Tfp pilus assembly protein FimT